MPRVKDYIALCADDEVQVPAWAPNAESPIVVHQRIAWSGAVFGHYILAHRVSGLSIRNHVYHYRTRSAALAAARKIAHFPEWRKLGRPKSVGEKVPGLTKKISLNLRSKLAKVLPEANI